MSEQDAYCSMIHGGLSLDFKKNLITQCCLLSSRYPLDSSADLWNNPKFIPLRETNKNNQWHRECEPCRRLELVNSLSFRQGTNQGLHMQPQTDLTGPVRIDLLFDNSCNLACRTCGTGSSTFWQKHLKEHGEWPMSIVPERNKDRVIDGLQKLDLSNLRQLVFCGGETLLGHEYWEVAEWLANNVPGAKDHLTVCFQTNGTQSVLPKNYDIIEKFHLVKMHVSLDGVGLQFEYLRWPANWNQVTDNILSLRQNLPSNVMFVVEETVSIFNLAYLEKLDHWVKENFSTNRDGDVVNHTRHLATGQYSLDHCSQEYVDAIKNTSYANLIPGNWREAPGRIKTMIQQIRKFDQYRNQSFEAVFPELGQYYSKFL